MLVKLIGYETKAFGRIMLPLYAAMLGFALITELSLRVMPEDFLSGLPGVLLCMLYGILMMSIVVMTCVLSVTRFYKNLLGVEGYLMFSLPTGTGTLIASKVISVILWSAMSTVTAVLAIVLTILGAGGIGPFREVLRAITSPTRIYAGIAIGHQFSDHRILMSVVALIGFNVIGTILANICGSLGVYSGLFDSIEQIIESDSIRALYLAQGGSMLFMAVQIIFFGVLTWFLLDRRLNLE